MPTVRILLRCLRITAVIAAFSGSAFGQTGAKIDEHTFLGLAIALTVSVAGGVLGLLGTALASIFVPAKIRRLEARVAAVDRQLNELYGPLLGECIRTDRVFLQVEHSISRAFGERHHSDLLPLKSSENGYKSQLARTYESLVRDVYHPANAAKSSLLKNHVHLFGAYPPLSFYLFLNHAAEMEAFLALGRQNLNTNQQIKRSLEREEKIAPFPLAMTAEVLGKVVLLKNLHQEYKDRISNVWSMFLPDDRRKVFSRRKYFLVIDESVRKRLDELNTCNSYNHFNLPILWGPYLPVELIEMRSWFMCHAEMLNEQPNLQDHVILTQAFLNAKLAEQSCYGTERFHLECRCFQALDAFDPLNAKRNIFWRTPSMTGDRLLAKSVKQTSETRFTYLRTGDELHKFYTLERLPRNKDFAYDPERFAKLHHLHGPGVFD